MINFLEKHGYCVTPVFDQKIGVDLFQQPGLLENLNHRTMYAHVGHVEVPALYIIHQNLEFFDAGDVDKSHGLPKHHS